MIPAPDTVTDHPPFRSFWMGGFECTDQLNAFGHRVDFLTVTQHLARMAEDYRKLGQLKIRTVREGIRWSQVERRPYLYDWSAVARTIAHGRRAGIQQIWDLCHFGFPDDLTPLHPMFARRFAALCRAFVRFSRSQDAVNPLIVTPINEVSFVSWLGGDVRGTSPYCVGQGWEVKYRLMKAYIEGVEALKELDPSIRILTTEPLVNITHDSDESAIAQAAAAKSHEEQFQVTDMLAGRICPELRGKPEYLDLLGFNFYYNNQWVKATHEILEWRRADQDPRWVPLHRLLIEAYRRYDRPMVLSETSHPKEDRPQWMDMIARECMATFEANVPLLGVCWYPILDRPDWDNLHDWHRAGIWERASGVDGEYDRALHKPTAEAFLRAQVLLENYRPRTGARALDAVGATA